MTRETSEMLTFGELIGRYMKDNGLTQIDMCDVVGRAQSTISAYKNNRQFPEQPEELKFFAQLFGISIHELVDAIEYGRLGYIPENPYSSLMIDLEKLQYEELRKKYEFVYKGEEISEDEYKKILKLLEFERFKPE